MAGRSTAEANRDTGPRLSCGFPCRGPSIRPRTTRWSVRRDRIRNDPFPHAMSKRGRILLVDDEPSVLAALQRNFRRIFEMDTAESATAALQLMQRNGPYAVLVADMQMPGMNGIELLIRAKEMAPDTVRLMLTGNADQETAVEAVNRGQIFRFLSKPCDTSVFQAAVEAAYREHNRLRTERALLESTVVGSVRVLAEVLAMIEPSSFGLGQRLRDSARAFGEWMNLPSTWELETAAALLHLGYAAIPTSVIRKMDSQVPLLSEELELVERTPQVGYELLAQIPRLETVAKNVLYVNKRYAGAGFPDDGLAGDSIPFGARVLRILRDRLLLEGDGVVKGKAYAEMHGRTGWYDVRLLEKCFLCFPEFMANAIVAETPVRAVPVEELKPGEVLVSDVRTAGGHLLVSAGNRLPESLIKRLRNYAGFHDVKEPIYVQ
ncbi:hypothetical protein DB347_15285 [Opitutaceae bacterium EW11]|nr:hypothetical protein DB347_15285 [Opitutaceae bacterium EW11]